MQKMAGKFLKVITLIMLVGLVSCSNQKGNEGTKSDLTDSNNLEVDTVRQGNVGGMLTSYFTLKDAFVTSDATRVRTEADKLKRSLDSVDVNLLTGEKREEWMQVVGTLNTSLDKIRESEDIEVQRQSFHILSNDMYNAVKQFGTEETVYRQYCPMAFNDEGAYWLSDKEEIRNPYFGDKMLRCGTVKEVLNAQ